MQQQNLLVPVLGPLYRALKPVSEIGLRLAAGLFFVPHGAQKLFGWFDGYGLEATGQYFEQQLGFSNGYLAALGAGSVEFFGGLFLAAGLLTRFSAAATAVLLTVAISLHLPSGFFWTQGGYEYPLLWLILVLTFLVKGGGSYSLDRLIGREI
ncbi:MAG: DoxX family protein [Kiloniellales bacterium]|nr:DoxX family protein [Kiloniellales bacterium]